jgi:hypothetical protein
MTILRRADETVSADPEAGYTTLIGFCVNGGNLYGASNGDSALVAIKANGCAEELTGNQAKDPPVGSASAQLVPFATKLIRPWLVLAMSDGVWKYVGLDRVKDIGTRLRGQVLVNCLQEEARLLGSRRLQDDFTVVLIQDRDEDRAVPGLPPALIEDI